MSSGLVQMLDLCRLCLVKDRVGVPIFEDEGDVRQVFLKIAACLPVKVSREDKLPKKICDDCMYKLELFYQFWNTTANAEKQLLQWLGEVEMEDKQGYVTGILNPDVMKQEQQQASENRLDGSVMQQVGTHQNMGMEMMDNMGLGMPIIISTSNQQMTSVPMDTSVSSVQTVQALPGPSTQSAHDQIAHDQIAQNQVTNVSGHHEEEEDSSEEEENETDDECDGDDGLPVKEEGEEDLSNRTVEPTTFVNVSLACDEAGPSGLQQQKITEMPEMTMPQVASADNKTGKSIDDGRFIYGQESIDMQPWQIVDLEGRLYYAFLPSKSLSNPVKDEIVESKSLSAEKSSKTLAGNDEKSQENSTQVGMKSIIGKDQHDVERDLETELKHEIGNETENEVNPEEEDEVDEIENQLTVMEHEENDEEESESHLDLNYDGVVLMQGEEDENGEIIGNEIYSPEEVYEVELKNEVMSADDLPKDVTIECSDGTKYNEGTKFYVCVKCDFYFTHLEDYKKHMSTLHEQDQRFKCKICYKVCKNLRSFKLHVGTEHKEDGVDAESLETLTYSCTYCTYKSTNKSTLNSHVSRKHLRPKNANINSKRIVVGEELACDACDFKCINKRRLKEHLERRHVVDYKYECDYCGKKFKVKGDMRLHVRFKHKEGPTVCDVCGKTCSNSNSLYVHQKWAHYKPKFECEICHRRMVTQENLDQHILLQHERRESFVCEECGKSFAENHRLKQHMMTHTGDRPFDCHICGKAFARRTSYRQHLLIHTGKRPYICDICGKTFTQKPGLICHRKSHPGVHPPLPVVYIEHILNDFMKKE